MQSYSRPSPQGYELERVTVSNRVVIPQKSKSTESSEYYEDGDDDDDEEAVEEQT